MKNIPLGTRVRFRDTGRVGRVLRRNASYENYRVRWEGRDGREAETWVWSRDLTEPARYRVRVNLNDDGFLAGVREMVDGGCKAVLGYERVALRFDSNEEAVALVARCVNIDAATIEPI